jgi:hypothetical protein
MNQEHNPGPGRPTLGEEPADHQIQLRVTKARKLAYMKAARPGKLTAWCLQHLDHAANYKPPES